MAISIFGRCDCATATTYGCESERTITASSPCFDRGARSGCGCGVAVLVSAGIDPNMKWQPTLAWAENLAAQKSALQKLCLHAARHFQSELAIGVCGGNASLRRAFDVAFHDQIRL